MKWLLISLCLFLLCCNWFVSVVKALEVTAGQEIEQTDLAQEFNQDAPTSHAVVKAQVVEILSSEFEEYTSGQSVVFQKVVVQLSGSGQGRRVNLDFNRTLNEGERPLVVGDKVVLSKSQTTDGQELFYVIDFVRTPTMLVLGLVFVVLVLVVGRIRGLWSLVGLVSSFVIIFSFILPGIQLGYDPIIVAIIGALVIIAITFNLTHGVSRKTTLAIFGTTISLILTGLLAKFFIQATRLTGFAAEEAAFLQVIKGGELNVQGLLLAGIIIGTLGVLDDITISQASVVQELKKANPKLGPKELFFRAMNVGHDHIASLVNTLVLVYTGSALPLLLLFTIDSSRSIETVLNYEIVAEEVVRTLVGSIGLVAAVPITTFLAAFYGFKDVKPKTLAINSKVSK